MSMCALVGCKSRAKDAKTRALGVRFFRFPKKDAEKRRRWTQIVHRQNEDGTR